MGSDPLALGSDYTLIGNRGGAVPESPCMRLWHEYCVRSRVIGSGCELPGIRAAEHLRVGQVGVESVTFGLPWHRHTRRDPHSSGDLAPHGPP